MTHLIDHSYLVQKQEGNGHNMGKRTTVSASGIRELLALRN